MVCADCEPGGNAKALAVLVFSIAVGFATHTFGDQTLEGTPHVTLALLATSQVRAKSSSKSPPNFTLRVLASSGTSVDAGILSLQSSRSRGRDRRHASGGCSPDYSN